MRSLASRQIVAPLAARPKWKYRILCSFHGRADADSGEAMQAHAFAPTVCAG